ncbi:hypothetical protein D3C72_773520 [compost metagenome]
MASHPAQPTVQIGPQIREDAQQRVLFPSAGLALNHPFLPLRQTVEHGRLHGGGGPRRHPCRHIAGVSSIGNAGGLLGVLDGGQRVEHLGIRLLDEAINPGLHHATIQRTQFVQIGLGLVDDVGLCAEIQLSHGLVCVGGRLAHPDTTFLDRRLSILLTELLATIRAVVLWASALQLFTQPLDKRAGLRSRDAIRHEADSTQRPGDPGYHLIPATAPGPLLQFRQMSHHFLGLGADVLVGVMGLHPVPHRLHAGVLLGLDEAAHQLGVFTVAQHVGKAVVSQHLMAQDLTHPLGVGDGVGSHMESAGIVVKRRATDQSVLGIQPQGPFKLPLGGVDLYLDAARPPVLLEPTMGNQLSLFTGQVPGRLVPLCHCLL